MSGFLHRLAARTLGLAPQIRPRAALPYAAPQPDFPGAGLAGQPLQAGPAEPDTGAARAQAEGQRNTHYQQQLPDPLLARAPDSKAAAMLLPVDRPGAPKGSELRRAIASFPASQPGQGFIPQHPGLPPPTPGPVRDSATTSPEAAQPRFGDLDTLVSRLLGQGQDDNQKTPPRPAPDLVPASAAAPAGVGSIRTRASRERPANPPLAAGTEAAPDVHITIGRLEVNPPSRPPPPPPAPAARGPAPLSLADYLAGRNRGRP